MNFIYNLFSSIVFQTVLSGTLVFVLGQIVQMFIFEKIFKYGEIIGRIDNRLKFYFLIIKNPGYADSEERTKRLQFCSQELLQLSCDLEACRKQLILRCGQKDKSVSRASGLLIKLHFGVFGENMSGENLKNLKEIRQLLNIPVLSE